LLINAGVMGWGGYWPGVIGLIPQLTESVHMDIPARSLVFEGQAGASPGHRTEAIGFKRRKFEIKSEIKSGEIID